MKVTPYLTFRGDCEAALKFYESAIGAKITGMLPFKGSPMESQVPAALKDKIMHAEVEIGGATLMASDGMIEGVAPAMSGFSITLNTDTPEENERLFQALAVGGRVTMPLQETFWAQSFGSLIDRYGLPWMFNCLKPM